jgi:hypothetical protein
MNSNPNPVLGLPRVQVNLSVVRAHYACALRRHTPRARRYAEYVAIRDIPSLVAEVERLWTLACDAHQRYADLKAAALACIAASEADEPDPMFYLRDELHARRPLSPRPRGRR